MPIYEYLCPHCKRIQEIMHSIKESPLIFCDVCEAGKSTYSVRLVGSSSFILKGSGWAKDGYSKSST
jgi:putative FmdB family regulatory protein